MRDPEQIIAGLERLQRTIRVVYDRAQMLEYGLLLGNLRRHIGSHSISSSLGSINHAKYTPVSL